MQNCDVFVRHSKMCLYFTPRCLPFLVWYSFFILYKNANFGRQLKTSCLNCLMNLTFKSIFASKHI